MKKLICVLFLLTVMLSTTSCWDSRELDTLFIVTGIGLDVSEKENEIAVDVQILNVSDGQSGSSGTQEKDGGGNDSAIVLTSSGKSALAAISSLRHESSRILFLHHNKLIVIGKDMAKQGIQDKIDMFLRDEETRLEALVMIADGKAKEVLNAKLNQDKISSFAVERIMQQYNKTSTYLDITLLKLVSALLSKTSAPLIPMIEVKKDGDIDRLNISKMAVLKNDKMVGELDWDEITGYLWTKGDINDGILELSIPEGTAAMNILSADNSLEPILQSDGRIGIRLNINSTLSIEELNGFASMDLKEVIDRLTDEAIHAIEKRVYTTFDKSKQLNTDFYGFSRLFQIKYPKVWTSLEQQWDSYYPTMQLVLSVHVTINSTGETTKSLDMEENQ